MVSLGGLLYGPPLGAAVVADALVSGSVSSPGPWSPISLTTPEQGSKQSHQYAHGKIVPLVIPARTADALVLDV